MASKALVAAVDGKAASHVYRLMVQLSDILNNGDFSPVLEPIDQIVCRDLRERRLERGTVVQFLDDHYQRLRGRTNTLPTTAPLAAISRHIAPIFTTKEQP
jgi:hypothetical protein